MNSTPRPPTATNTRGHPPEFQQLIRQKSENFVGRKFVFAAINEFLHKCDRGYFTIVGAPGSGKSAILAKYVTENPHVIYYSAQIEGKNRADQFLLDICAQLINYYPDVEAEYSVSLPDNATEGSWFLSLLLQKISDSLEPNQPLIIAIDALDAIAPNSQAASSNLFYLPRYLPHKVYFLLTRRPFVRERSRLLIETPSQILDLGDYPEQNREDVQAYIRQCLTPLTSSLKLRLGKGATRMKEGTRMEESSDRNSPPFLTLAGGDLKSWLTTHHLSEEEFRQKLKAQSENNFMYLSQILPAISEGFYSKPLQFEPLPPGLEAYYQSHWQRMKGKGSSSVELGVLRCLSTQPPPSLEGKRGEREEISAEAVSEAMSATLIAQMIDEDEYEVEEVLENWIEFLQQQRIEGEICYSLYHSSFRDWLGRQVYNG
jgi:hypothetical protein